MAAAERDLAVLLADPAISPAAKNTRLIPAAQDKITAAHKKLAAAAAARDTIPAKLPANLIDPEAQVALLRTCRRGLQMVLRLLAHNAEHWLANHLNAYLHDDDEYRAITRQTIIRGLAGTITYTPQAITVELQQARRPPRRPRPGPAHRRDQPHPARHARRHQAHHLPAHRTPARIKQITQTDYRRSESGQRAPYYWCASMNAADAVMLSQSSQITRWPYSRVLPASTASGELLDTSQPAPFPIPSASTGSQAASG